MKTIQMTMSRGKACQQIAKMIVEEMTREPRRTMHAIVINEGGEVELAYRDNMPDAAVVVVDLNNASCGDFGDWDESDPESMIVPLAEMYEADWLIDACRYSASDEDGVELMWPDGSTTI